MKFTKVISSPLGPILLEVEGNFVTRVHQVDDAKISPELGADINNARLLSQAELELGEYFAGRRQNFSLPLKRKATAFQEKVWQEMSRIPYGKTLSYQELAERVGSPKAARAVGDVCRRNPHLIVVPCHRVKATGGGLGGFALGLAAKEHLLRLEAVSV